MSDIPLTPAPALQRHGSNIGQPMTRRDGILKVTSGARYAADLEGVIAGWRRTSERCLGCAAEGSERHPARVPASTASAARARHGFSATPPSAMRA